MRLSRVGDVYFDGIAFDDHPLPVTTDSVELLPGEHRFRLHYHIEEYECDQEDPFCLATRIKGICEGSLTTRADRPYLLTVETTFSGLDLRVSAKGYFEFSARADEPEPGHGYCRETSRS